MPRKRPDRKRRADLAQTRARVAHAQASAAKAAGRTHFDSPKTRRARLFGLLSTLVSREL